jgi:RNA-binding protein 26
VVPSQLLPMANMSNGMMPFMSMMNNAMFGGMNGGIGGGGGAMGANGGAYDPHERMDMRPRAAVMRPPMMHRQDGSIPSSGELPVIQDLTPRVPLEDQRHDQYQNGAAEVVRGDDGVQGYPSASAMEVDTDGVPQTQHHNRQQPQNIRNHHPNGGNRGGGRRGSRVPQPPGTFPINDFPQADIPPATSHPFPTSVPRPERRNDKTLVVEKIPEEHLSLGAVNDWFKRFGTVTNVAVDVQSAKALVSFLDHDDAHKAWKSEDAVFGNRFVKVFWHRPMSGHGGIGSKMLKASAPLVSRLAAHDAGGTTNSTETTPSAPGLATTSSAEPAPTIAAPPTPNTTKHTSSNAVSALAAKQQLLNQQIVEQKNLMAKLETASSPEEKKEILGRLRKLGDEMKNSATASSSSVASTPTKRPTPTSGMGRSEDQERLEKERLDKELELHAAATGADGDVEESTEQLKAKLAKLKAEVRIAFFCFFFTC